MGFDNKDTTNVFDKADQGNALDEMMAKLQENRDAFVEQLNGDWLLKTFQICASRCLEEGAELRDRERLCARNCVRKHQMSLAMYESMEDKIMEKFQRDWRVDAGQPSGGNAL